MVTVVAVDDVVVVVFAVSTVELEISIFAVSWLSSCFGFCNTGTNTTGSSSGNAAAGKLMVTRPFSVGTIGLSSLLFGSKLFMAGVGTLLNASLTGVVSSSSRTLDLLLVRLRVMRPGRLSSSTTGGDDKNMDVETLS